MIPFSFPPSPHLLAKYTDLSSAVIHLGLLVYMGFFADESVSTTGTIVVVGFGLELVLAIVWMIVLRWW